MDVMRASGLAPGLARWLVVSVAIVVALGVDACAGGTLPKAGPSAATADLVLVDLQGARVPAEGLLAGAPWTVLVFFSAECHVVRAHQDRLSVLATSFRAQGVQFAWVDSEAIGSPERDRLEVRRRALTFPLLLDPGARWADRLGVRDAATAVVLDRAGRVHYIGAIDSDGARLHADAEPALADALDDLLDGHEPRMPRSESRGCMLEK